MCTIRAGYCSAAKSSYFNNGQPHNFFEKCVTLRRKPFTPHHNRDFLANTNVFTDAGDQLPGLSAKPGSAGSSVRDAAQRILQLCQKGEWPPVEQALKSLEKMITGGGDDSHSMPLSGVSDIVRTLKLSFGFYFSAGNNV